MENLRRIIIPFSDQGYNFSYFINAENKTIIDRVDKFSYAERAGLKVGDIIMSINGYLVKNLTGDEIKEMLTAFNKTSLVLTIVPNLISKSKDEIMKSKSRTLEGTTTRQTFGRPTYPNKSSSLKEDSGKTKRKFTKYSRNMSDVTDNSRLYCIQQQQRSRLTQNNSRRGSSPPYVAKYPPQQQTPSPRVSPVLSSDGSNNNRRRLQLNRVGGLVRTTTPPKRPLPNTTNLSDTTAPTTSTTTTTSTVTATTAPPIGAAVSNTRRHSKLTFLTCSPMPYRSSSRQRGSEANQDIGSLDDSEQHTSSKASYDLSMDDDKSRRLESAAKNRSADNINSGEGESDEEGDGEDEELEITELHSYEIKPSLGKIMWKTMNGVNMSYPQWKKSQICVENGIFKVLKEYDDNYEEEEEADCDEDRLVEEEEEEDKEVAATTSVSKPGDDVYSFLCNNATSNPPKKPDKKPDNKPDNKPLVFSFDYIDANNKKWDFLIEFDNEKSSQKWIQYFDAHKSNTINTTANTSSTTASATARSTGNNNNKNNQSLRTSKPRTSQSQIISPVVASQVLESVQANKSESTSNKSRLHYALSRVRNFTTRRLTHTDSQSEFKKQQEEWLQKTEPHFHKVVEDPGSNSSSKQSPPQQQQQHHSSFPSSQNTSSSQQPCVNVCMDHVGYSYDNKVHQTYYSTLGLDKWQRSTISPLIPFIVEVCVKVIEKFGLSHVGIYRVSGNKLSLDILNGELRKPIHDIDLSSDVWNDIYAISGILKSFLRNLPDGVFPKAYYAELLAAWRQHEHDREKRLLSVQRLLSILDSVPNHPEYRHHRETLRYLAHHLHSVSLRHSINKMTVKNLAVVFAPTLIRPAEETNELLMGDYRFRIELVENIINFHEWMFSPSFESACNIPEEIIEEEHIHKTNGAGVETQFERNEEDDRSSSMDEDPDEENSRDTFIGDNRQDGSSDARSLIKELLDEVSNLVMNSEDTVGEHVVEHIQPVVHQQLATATSHGTDLISPPSIPYTDVSPTADHQYTLIELVPHKDTSVVAKEQLQTPAESFIAEKHSCCILEDGSNTLAPCNIDNNTTTNVNSNSHTHSHKEKEKEKEKHSIKRPSFKLKKSFRLPTSSSSTSSSANTNSSSKLALSHMPKDQLMLTNKKLYALSLALITTSNHPLNSPIIAEQSATSPTGSTD